MKYTYNTKGTCSSRILIDMDENGTILSAEFVGGCHGNTDSDSIPNTYGDSGSEEKGCCRCRTWWRERLRKLQTGRRVI